jgi:hypothetical protein
MMENHKKRRKKFATKKKPGADGEVQSESKTDAKRQSL